MSRSKGKEKARPKSADFTEAETNALVSIVYDLFKESGESELITGRVNWDAVTDKMNGVFKHKRTTDNIRSRFGTLKGQFNLFKELRGRSKWTWDAIHSKIVAPNDEAWKALIESNKVKWRPLKNGKRFPWYDVFALMMGSSVVSGEHTLPPKPYLFSPLSSRQANMASSLGAKSAETETTMKTEILEQAMLFPPQPIRDGLESHGQVGPTILEFQSVVPDSGCENLDLPPSPPPLPVISGSTEPDALDVLSFKTGPPLKKSRVMIQSEFDTGTFVSGTAETSPPLGFATIDSNRSKKNSNSGHSFRQRTQQLQSPKPEPVASIPYSACEGGRTIQNALTAVRMLSTKGLKQAGKMLLLNCHATLRDFGQEHRLHRILRDNNLPIDVANIPSDDEAQVLAPATMQDCEPYCQGMPPPTYPADETGPSQGPSLECYISSSDCTDDCTDEPALMVPMMQERGDFAGTATLNRWPECIWQQHSIPCAEGTDASLGNCKEKARPKSADFTESETNALVSIVYDLFKELGESELLTLKVNWDAVRDKLNEAFRKNRTSDNVRSRFRTLKTTFNRFKELRSRDGWTWDTVHSTIVAPNEEAWKNLIESEKKKWRPLKNGKRFPWYNVFALMVGGSAATEEETNEGSGSSKMSLVEDQNLNLNNIHRSFPSEKSVVQPVGASESTGLGKRKTREEKPPNGLQTSASKVDVAVALEYIKNILDTRPAQAQTSSVSTADWKAKLESFNLPHDEYWYMYDLMKDPFYVQQLMDVTDENRESYLRRKMPWYNQNRGNVAPNPNTTPFVGYMQPSPPVGYKFCLPF